MSSLSTAVPKPGFAASTRGQIAALILLALIAGGFAPLVMRTLGEQGLAGVLNGGGASWVVWLAVGLAVWLSLRAPPERATRADLAWAGLCALAIVAPAHFVINLAGTALALRYAFAPGMPKELRGAGVILFALFFSVFWSIHLFPMFAGPLAVIDAWWVGLAGGVSVDGNVVSLKSGEGSFLLAGPCTSVNNASLALLLWVAISRAARPEGSRREWLVALGVFATAMAINVARLVLMSRDMELFDLLHGNSWVATAVMASGLVWAFWDVRRELFA